MFLRIGYAKARLIAVDDPDSRYDSRPAMGNLVSSAMLVERSLLHAQQHSDGATREDLHNRYVYQRKVADRLNVLSISSMEPIDGSFPEYITSSCGGLRPIFICITADA